MMKVTVEVNGRTIAEGWAVNRGNPGDIGGVEPEDRFYELHDGIRIVHNRDDGAIPLAKRILDRAEVEPEP